MTALQIRLANPRADRVRSVHRLTRRVGRSAAGRFLAEGPQAVREALWAHSQAQPGAHAQGRGAPGPGDVVQDLYVTQEAAARYVDELALALSAGVPVVGVSDEVMAAMTDTVTPQGLLAVCRTVDRPLSDVLAAATDPATGVPRLIAVLAHVRDPGNAGTVLRAADAAGADAVLLSAGSVDVHNPKCVRSTAGSVFHLPIAQGVLLPDAVRAMRSAGMVVLAADGAGDLDLDDLLDAVDADRGAPTGQQPALLRRPTAWLFGNEAWGLPDDVRGLADAVVRVPLRGRAESLNLAMAATLCLYASSRCARAAR